MKNDQLKTFSKVQKSMIIDAIHTDDIEFLLNYLHGCTPYQLAEWSEDPETPRYLNLYLYFFMDNFTQFSDVFGNACLTFWSSYEKEDAISKGEIPAEDFLPQDYEDFHIPFLQVITKQNLIATLRVAGSSSEI